MFLLPPMTKDNNADYYDESHENAQRDSDTNGSCKCYISIAVHWNLHNTTCAIHVKAYKHNTHDNIMCQVFIFLLYNTTNALQIISLLFWILSSIFALTAVVINTISL